MGEVFQGVWYTTVQARGSAIGVPSRGCPSGVPPGFYMRGKITLLRPGGNGDAWQSGIPNQIDRSLQDGHIRAPEYSESRHPNSSFLDKVDCPKYILVWR